VAYGRGVGKERGEASTPKLAATWEGRLFLSPLTVKPCREPIRLRGAVLTDRHTPDTAELATGSPLPFCGTFRILQQPETAAWPGFRDARRDEFIRPSASQLKQEERDRPRAGVAAGRKGCAALLRSKGITSRTRTPLGSCCRLLPSRAPPDTARASRGESGNGVSTRRRSTSPPSR